MTGHGAITRRVSDLRLRISGVLHPSPALKLIPAFVFIGAASLAATRSPYDPNPVFLRKSGAQRSALAHPLQGECRQKSIQLELGEINFYGLSAEIRTSSAGLCRGFS